MLYQAFLRRMGVLAPAALFVILATGCAATVRADQPNATDSSAIKPDAVHELCENHWTLQADGGVVYRQRTHVQLNNDRVYRHFADPRITYDATTQELEVLEARTRLPDGSYVPLADYSAVEVAPDAAAGWPAFGGLRQRVLVMGGIEAGCVLEVEYQITTKPGHTPFLAADLRIDDEYPVIARTVTVTLPPNQELSPVISGIAESDYQYSFQQNSAGGTTHRWDFVGLKGKPHETQGVPWRQSSVRLAFTTAPSGDAWLRGRLVSIADAAAESPLVTRLAEDWTKELYEADEKLAAVQNKFADTFNFVNFDVDWQPRDLRSANDVLNGNYGLPAEAAAALLAICNAADIPVKPAILAADDVWEPAAAGPALVAAYVLVFDGPDGLEIWHPHNGQIHRDAHWAGHTLFHQNGDALARIAWPAWRKADDSRCVVRGNVTLDKDGKFTGKLNVRTSGLFVSPGRLAERGDQESQIRSIVRDILPAASVKDFTVTRLSSDEFEAQVDIERKDELDKLHDSYELTLGDTFPGLSAVSIPWQYSRRQTPVQLTGPFDEQVDLTIEWPEEVTINATPQSLNEIAGEWGRVVQTASAIDNGVRLVRQTRIERYQLAADEVLALRPALQMLQTAACHTLLIEP